MYRAEEIDLFYEKIKQSKVKSAQALQELYIEFKRVNDIKLTPLEVRTAVCGAKLQNRIDIFGIGESSDIWRIENEFNRVWVTTLKSHQDQLAVVWSRVFTSAWDKDAIWASADPPVNVCESLYRVDDIEFRNALQVRKAIIRWVQNHIVPNLKVDSFLPKRGVVNKAIEESIAGQTWEHSVSGKHHYEFCYHEDIEVKVSDLNNWLKSLVSCLFSEDLVRFLKQQKQTKKKILLETMDYALVQIFDQQLVCGFARWQEQLGLNNVAEFGFITEGKETIVIKKDHELDNKGWLVMEKVLDYGLKTVKDNGGFK